MGSEQRRLDKNDDKYLDALDTLMGGNWVELCETYFGGKPKNEKKK